jgi:hypothetical protein
MKTNLLLPYRFKSIGWFLLIPGLIMGFFYLIKQDDVASFFQLPVISVFNKELFADTIELIKITQNNVYDEIASILIIIGGILVAFSKEKLEDEYIAKIRLESLVWATYINYAILLVTLIFMYELTFFWVLVVNMFTILLFFIVKFRVALSQLKKTNTQ